MSFDFELLAGPDLEQIWDVTLDPDLDLSLTIPFILNVYIQKYVFKVEILLDMLAQKTAESNIQETELERLQHALQSMAPTRLALI